MRHAERVAEVLDGEVPVLLRLGEESDRCRLGHEAARREVVDLEPLLQEVGVVGGRRVPEQPMRHRLQRHRAEAVTAGDRRRRQVDASVLEVGHRPGGVRQVVDVDELEAQLRRHDADAPVRERAAGVPRGRELLLGEVLDLGQVVAPLPHAQAQLGVRAPGLLGRRDRLALAALQLAVQAQDRLDRLVGGRLGDAHGGDAEAPEHGRVLRLLEVEFEGGAPVRRLGGEEVGDIRARRVRDRLQQRQLRLALAVLDEAQLTARHPDERAQLVEGVPPRDAVMTDAVTERRQLESRSHSLMIAKQSRFLRPVSFETRPESAHSGNTSTRDRPRRS